MLSSIFKPKPMISLVLTKEIEEPLKEETDYSCFEARLDKLANKLQKLKKYSKKVFECNNLETLSAVEECCAQVKKERCKAKKQKKSKANVCSKSPNECAMDGGDSMDIDDFSCGDQVTLSGESGECGDDEGTCPEEEANCDEDNGEKSEDECEEKEKNPCAKEEKNPCEKEEKNPCAKAEKVECGEDESEDEETNECEEEIKKSSCKNKGDDKCTQVMIFQPKGSTYLLSQIEFEKDYISKPVTRNPTKKGGSSAMKTGKSNSFDIPITTAKSLSKASSSRSKTTKSADSEDDLFGENDSLSKQKTLQTYSVQSSSRVGDESNINKMGSRLSQGKNRSKSLSRPGSKSSIKKTPPRSMSACRTPPNSHISKVNEESLTKENVSSESNARKSTSNMSGSNSENKQSIVYIVQTPSKQNEGNLIREGPIRIDAEKVFIQNNPSPVQSGSHQVIIKAQKSSEKEVVISETTTATPSDKFESRVSSQQPGVIKGNENISNLVGPNQVDDSTNALYENSSKIISNITSPQPVMKSNAEFKSESKASQASVCDTTKTSQDQFVSECSLMKPSQVQFASDCEIYYSSSGNKFLVKKSLNGSSTITHSKEPLGSVNSSKHSTVSFDQKKMVNNMESQTIISGISQNARQDIQVQSVVQSRSGLQNNSASKISRESSGVSAGNKEEKMITERISTESQTMVMPSTLMNVKVNNSIEKDSLIVIPNISGAKDLNNSTPKQISSHSSVKGKDNASILTSKESNSSKGKVRGSMIRSSKALDSQEVSETSQKNETIAMFLNTTMESSKNQGNDFLVMHCTKCREVCIAKIIDKKQSSQNIWVGQGN